MCRIDCCVNLFCSFQVVLEKKLTLFIDDPLKVPGLEKNEDWVKYGYGYYVGAPWVVGQIRGMCLCTDMCDRAVLYHHKQIDVL